MKFKAIVLDFDGTLIESVGIKDKAFEEMFSKYPEYLNQIMEYHFANNAVIRFNKFRYITKNILKQPYTEETASSLSKEFSQRILEKIINCPFVEGAEEFLDYFYRQIPVYLVSVNPKSDLDKIIQAKNLSRYFKKIYAVGGFKKDTLNEILRDEGISASQAVFIGDTNEDYQASQAAGIYFIGRDSGKPFGDNGLPVYKNLVEIKDFLMSN